MATKHWDEYLTMSIVHFMAFPETIGGEGPIADTVRIIAEDPFFSGIEIGWIKDPAVRSEVKGILSANGMKVGHGAQSALLLQGLNLNSLDSDERHKAVTQLKASIDEGSELEVQRVAFLSGKDPGDSDRPAALDALVDSVNEACEHAGSKGIALTCETFDRDIDKKCLIGPSDYAADFAQRVRMDHADFGLMYDLSHMPLIGEDPEPALTTLKDVLVHVHVGNCVVDEGTPGYGDQHPRFGWPGGVNDVPELSEFLKALFDIGYLAEGRDPKPWVGFEVKPQSKGEDSVELIEQTKAVWEEAWPSL